MGAARPWAAIAVGMAGMLAAGCSSDESRRARFVPSSETARQALVNALDAWRREKPAGKLSSGQKVTVADTHRRPGQKLVSYRIVGEAPLEDGRRFVVRLTFDNPEQEERAQFLIIGIDPLYVIRQEDYDMITHWDHPMEEETPAAE
jgi:hypothetical protein